MDLDGTIVDMLASHLAGTQKCIRLLQERKSQYKLSEDSTFMQTLDIMLRSILGSPLSALISQREAIAKSLDSVSNQMMDLQRTLDVVRGHAYALPKGHGLERNNSVSSSKTPISPLILAPPTEFIPDQDGKDDTVPYFPHSPVSQRFSVDSTSMDATKFYLHFLPDGFPKTLPALASGTIIDGVNKVLQNMTNTSLQKARINNAVWTKERDLVVHSATSEDRDILVQLSHTWAMQVSLFYHTPCVARHIGVPKFVIMIDLAKDFTTGAFGGELPQDKILARVEKQLRTAHHGPFSAVEQHIVGPIQYAPQEKKTFFEVRDGEKAKAFAAAGPAYLGRGSGPSRVSCILLSPSSQ